MRFFRLLGFALCGALMMVALLAWMAQFFHNDEERRPVIRLDPVPQEQIKVRD